MNAYLREFVEEFKLCRNPTYDGIWYENKRKYRGVLLSMLIGAIIWIFCATLLTIFLSAIYCALMFAVQNGKVGDIFCTESMMGTFMFALFVEFVSRGTAYIGFLAARTEKSLRKAILLTIFVPRVGCGSEGSDRINRINTYGC